MSDGKKHRILCVSRSTSQLRLIVSHFPVEEFETILSFSPEEAVAFCAANHISGIVLDSEFVTEDGWTVAQSFRMVKPRLPIVLLKRNHRHHHHLPPHVDVVACKAEMIPGALKTLLNGETTPAMPAKACGG